MEFRTQVRPEKAGFSFSYAHSTLLLGSCFAENIGEKLASHCFAVDVNPFGTLYNPASVSAGVRMLAEDKRFTASDLFLHEDLYHSFAHHSRFSASTEEDCLRQINERMVVSSASLKSAGRLVVTFGTAWVYRLKRDGRIAANCHKLPEKLFIRSRLTVDEIVDDWTDLIDMLLRGNPDLKILFTVSPIRHWKDGANGNQLSKATLLLAVDELRRRFPDSADYFPAYEIMMDELRDYRFYADDMLHPSPLAVDYIWECFSGQFLDREAQALLKDLAAINKAVSHKPFNPESDSYKDFLQQTLLKAEHVNARLGRDRLAPVIALLKEKLHI